jgi:hypothetical protein
MTAKHEPNVEQHDTAFGLRQFKRWLNEVRGMTGLILASPEDQQKIRRLAGR